MKLPVERFWSKVNKTETCWLWAAAKDPNGYGRMSVYEGGKWRCRLAHRMSWTLTHGDPGKLFVLHKCDTPACVRPEHLFVGTQADNMRDCAQKGRATGNKGKLAGLKHPMAKINWEIVRAIRASDDTQRQIARQFGVHQTLVSLIQRRKIWIEKE